MITVRRLAKEEKPKGCEKCGEPTNNAEPICLQCHIEEQEYWKDVKEDFNQFNPKQHENQSR